MSIIHNMYSVKEAAELIGITSGRLRQMIIAYGERSPSRKATPTGYECRAVKYEAPIFPAGYIWQVPQSEIDRLKAMTQHTGRPRKG